MNSLRNPCGGVELSLRLRPVSSVRGSELDVSPKICGRDGALMSTCLCSCLSFAR